MSEPSCFVDPAFVVRHLTHDVEPLASIATSLFSAVERGDLTVQMSETVVLETIYALTTQYGIDRLKVAPSLSGLIELDGIVLPSKRYILEALRLWIERRRLSFADAYHLVLASHSSHRRIASFDQCMDRCLPGVTRIEEFP